MDALYVIRGYNIVQQSGERAWFEMAGIASGEYTVTAIEHPHWGGAGVLAQQSKDLVLRDGEWPDVNFDLRNVERRTEEIYGRWLREQESRKLARKRSERMPVLAEAREERRGTAVRCSGRVLDRESHALPGAEVEAFFMRFDQAGNVRLEKVRELETGADGSFLVHARRENPRITEGLVVARANGLAVGWSNWSLVGHQKMALRLMDAAGIGGVVLDEDGRPIAGAEVRATLFEKTEAEEQGGWVPGIAPLDWLLAASDAEGRFRIESVPTDAEVGLIVKAEGKSTLYLYGPKTSPPFAPGHANINVILPEEARITGRVIDKQSGAPIPGLTLAVVPRFSNYFFERFTVVTKDDGTFSIGGLRTGSYLVRGGVPSLPVDVESGKVTDGVTIEKEASAASEPYSPDTGEHGHAIERLAGQVQIADADIDALKRIDERGLLHGIDLEVILSVTPDDILPDLSRTAGLTWPEVEAIESLLVEGRVENVDALFRYGSSEMAGSMERSAIAKFETLGKRQKATLDGLEKTLASNKLDAEESDVLAKLRDLLERQGVGGIFRIRKVFKSILGSSGKASWSALFPKKSPDGEMMYLAIINVSVDGKFPIRFEGEEVVLFRCHVIEGNDDRLVVEVVPESEDLESEPVAKLLNLERDRPVDYVLAEKAYTFLYPSRYVTRSSGRVDDTALVFVTYVPAKKAVNRSEK